MKSSFVILWGVSWLKERWRAVRGNALWDGVKLVAIGILLPVGYAIWSLVRKQPLEWTILFSFVALGLFFLFFAALRFRRISGGKK